MAARNGWNGHWRERYAGAARYARTSGYARSTTRAHGSRRCRRIGRGRIAGNGTSQRTDTDRAVTGGTLCSAQGAGSRSAATKRTGPFPMNEVASLFNNFPAQNAHALLRGRRTIRHYRSGLPPAVVLDRIFTSVAAAPSAHNRQPWRYGVITDPGNKARLAEVMSARLAADRRRDGDDEDAIRHDVNRSIDRITNAPVVIVVAMTLTEMDSYP